MEEIWKPLVGVPEVEGQFLISNFGRVKRIVFTTANQPEYKTPKVYGNGYHYILFTVGRKKVYNKRLHRLVALAFVPNPNNYPEVNHKDGDKLNNRADNLEWTTRSQNELHKCRVLGVKHRPWTDEEKAHFAKCAKEQYENGRGLYGYNQRAKKKE